MKRIYALPFCFIFLFSFCTERKDMKNAISLDETAEEYVLLAHSIGKYDPDYIDAYFGPDSLKEKASKLGLSLEDIKRRLKALRDKLGTAEMADRKDPSYLRHKFQQSMTGSMIAKVEMLTGKKFTFDEESKALYHAVSPDLKDGDFEAVQKELDSLLPGNGALPERLEAFKKEFYISKERLDTVFRAAIKEAKARTLKNLALPGNESFDLEYVKDKPWSGYNWFKGNSHSLIQINTDLPIAIDRAVDLAAHEGYPGHHTYHSSIEKNMVKGAGWVEFTVYPLFSPLSLLSEGTANFGIEVAFPGKERTEFEKNVLFPLAGMDATKADLYYRVQKLLAKLTYAGNVAAKRYRDGEFTAAEAVDYMMKYSLMNKERAGQRLRFIDKYGAYVINYNVGQDLVRKFVNEKGGTDENPGERWRIFEDLLSHPYLPEDISGN